MKYIARRFRLKGEGYCMLRSPEPADAALRIDFLRAVNAETDFMARGAEDSPADEDVVAEILADQLEDPAAVEIAAFADDRMIACGGISPAARAYPRKRHRAVFGICVRKEFWGRGIGRGILEALMREAEGLGYSQVELTVVSDNLRARKLYETCGFVQTGIMPDALRREDGSFADEIFMVRKLHTKKAPE